MERDARLGVRTGGVPRKRTPGFPRPRGRNAAFPSELKGVRGPW